jgi:hypothetical protein
VRPLPHAPPAPPPCHHHFLYGGAEQSSARFAFQRIKQWRERQRATRTSSLIPKKRGIKTLRRETGFDTLSKEALNRRSRPLRATEETAGFEHEVSGRNRGFRRAPTESSWGRRSRYNADPDNRRPYKRQNQPKGWFCFSTQSQVRGRSVSLQLEIIELDRSRPPKQ